MQFQEGQSDEASLKRWLDEKGVYKVLSEMKRVGTSLAVQWTLHSSGGGTGLIPGWGAKIPHDLELKNQKIKQKQYCNIQ